MQVPIKDKPDDYGEAVAYLRESKQAQEVNNGLADLGITLQRYNIRLSIPADPKQLPFVHIDRKEAADNKDNAKSEAKKILEPIFTKFQLLEFSPGGQN